MSRFSLLGEGIGMSACHNPARNRAQVQGSRVALAGARVVP